jgi:predicted TIM-barrel fold metal-dependent hydrolase
MKITNCHIHTFTSRHVPEDYPHWALRPFKRFPRLIRALARLPAFIISDAGRAALHRLYKFTVEGQQPRQADILDSIIPMYPRDTRFVVLPMDLSQAGWGAPPVSVNDQHRELDEMRNDPRFRGLVIPFATLDPRRDGAAEETAYWIGKRGFRGLKLYPRLGFPPSHPVLMDRIYPMLLERNLPVMTHCSGGGVQGRGVPDATADEWSSPMAWKQVRDRFPDLRVCLAHFGGMQAWKDYIETGIDPRDPAAAMQNWQSAIRTMIEGDDWPNLWTDISYTLFDFDTCIPFLKIFLQEPKLADRVLFGSDFYMTRQEALQERAVCFRLRAALGDDMFRKIAVENPKIWLGETLDAA